MSSLSLALLAAHPATAAAVDTAAGVGIPLALAAGFVSFLSPCVLPLVPGYLSAVAGVSPVDLGAASMRRVLVPALWFVGSFSSIFILLGLSATALGSTLSTHRLLLDRVGAWMIVGLGVLFVASAFIPRLGREWHSERLLAAAGRGGPVVAGAAFAVAWTPCSGPTLTAILGQAAVSQSAAHGALLLAFYSAGLAIPFLLTAVAFARLTGLFAAVRRHYGVVIFAGGAVLIGMGVLILTGAFTVLNQDANTLLQGTGLNVSSI